MTLKNYHLTDERIVVKEGLGEVMIHELTHALLHANSSASFGDKVYSKQEFEAESVAYIVSNHLGLDTGGYLSSWTDRGNDLSELTESLKTITEEAKKLIDSVDLALNKIYTVDTPKNKFEERVAIAKNKSVAGARKPKNKNQKTEGKTKKTVEQSVTKRMTPQS